MKEIIPRKIFIHATNVHQGGGHSLLVALLKVLHDKAEFVFSLDERMPIPKGDLPLRCNAPQTVFVQTSHLLKPARFSLSNSSIKFAILRAIFRLNLRHARAFIVQTSLMKDGLIATYPHA